jgi:hypothetical protein
VVTVPFFRRFNSFFIPFYHPEWFIAVSPAHFLAYHIFDYAVSI